ncbi:UNVERIFIED_CONTAM: hypothetical protein FKN15_008425 [Acipenser sinensis]
MPSHFDRRNMCTAGGKGACTLHRNNQCYSIKRPQNNVSSGFKMCHDCIRTVGQGYVTKLSER